MDILKKIIRILLIIIAVFVIVLGVSSLVGTWYVNRVATDVTIKVFSVVDTGVSVAQTGVERVNTLVIDGRSEVQQAEQNIVTVGDNLEANSPVLTALSERLDTRLAPTVQKIETALEPVRGALSTASAIVSILNSIPRVQENAPNLVKLDQVFADLEQMSADIKQLDTTLRETVVTEKNALTQEVVTVMTDLTTRIDTRLAGVQTEIENVLNEILVLQGEITALRSQMLLIYNLAAVAMTLFLIWLIYSQVVVIRQQWRLVRQPTAAPAVAALPASVQQPSEPLAQPELVDDATDTETIETTPIIATAETAAEADDGEPTDSASA